MKRVRVMVRGRVQGVFFRATCAARAREAGLGGYVRNTPEGDVEAAFEGPDEAVDMMVSWCRRGPDLARVDELEMTPETPTGSSGFRVTG